MTITVPLRRITLHFSQIGFTDGLTFIKITSLSLSALRRHSSRILMLERSETVLPANPSLRLSIGNRFTNGQPFICSDT